MSLICCFRVEREKARSDSAARAYRSRRRLPVLFREPDPEVRESAAMAQPPRTPEELVVDAVFDDAVEPALAALPARFRRVVELVDVAGLSYAEAGLGARHPPAR